MEKGKGTTKSLQEEIQECAAPITGSIDDQVQIYEFSVVVSTANDWKTFMVQISDLTDNPFEAWLAAAEYFINVVTTMSELPYDEALKLLKTHAATYKELDVS